MRYLSVTDVFELHQRLITESGGREVRRDQEALVSAVRQPHMQFGGEEVHPSISENAAALGFAQIRNHPFVDGNKRVGHAPMEVFLILNGWEIEADVDEQERLILDVAAGAVGRDEPMEWLSNHIVRHQASTKAATPPLQSTMGWGGGLRSAALRYILPLDLPQPDSVMRASLPIAIGPRRSARPGMNEKINHAGWT